MSAATMSEMPVHQQHYCGNDSHHHHQAHLRGGHPTQTTQSRAMARAPSAEAFSLCDKQTIADVAALRAALPEELRPLASDSDCLRFLRATGGKVHESAKRLQATLLWRQQHQPDHIVCTACAKDPRSHYMHVVGYDLQQRPIIYSCFEPATNKVYKDNLDHMLATFETAIKLMPPGVEQWVWACDFHGMSMSDVSPKLAKAFLSISAEHYPERLGMFLILDAPGLFGMLWKAIQPFVDPKTHSKIRFVPFDPQSPKSQLRSTLGQVCEPHTADWLINEMTENRDSKLAAQKAYSMPHLHHAASKGDLAAPPGGKHDMRGSHDLLQKYLSSPSLLEPQGTASVPRH